MRRDFFVFLVCVAAIVSGASVHAADWYVRPADGVYGLENGTSYENAWNGLLNVVWGSGGVQPGDTLWICGLHVYRVTSLSYIATQADIHPISGLSEDLRIVMRGDDPREPGIVWGAYGLNYSNWTDEGDGVWSIPLPGNQYPDWFFQDIGQPNPDSFIVLDKEDSVEAVRSHPGSHFSADYLTGSRLYVKCTDGGDPTGRIYANRWGYDFHLGENTYLTFLNLKLMNPTRIDPNDRPSHIRWQGCTLAYGEHSLLGFWYATHYMQVVDCDLSWASNGIYNISDTNEAPSYYLYKGNHIHEIGVRPVNQNSDAHAIGIQGGRNGIIEDNFIENCGTGPLLYAFEGQELVNTVVRKNFVRDLHTLGGATGYGVATQCSNLSFADKSGNRFYLNIVVNSPVGYRFQFENDQEFYNNVAEGCGISLQAARSATRDGIVYGPRIIGKNNILLASRFHHIDFGTNAQAGDYALELSHNLYYPDGDNKFKFGGSGFRNFAGWQELGFDQSSLVSNPFFVDQSGGYAAAADFKISGNSPARDNGADTGLSSDFEGKPIEGLPDIGAFEYSQGSRDGMLPPQGLRVGGGGATGGGVGLRLY
jgi:hypothetical protein